MTAYFTRARANAEADAKNAQGYEGVRWRSYGIACNGDLERLVKAQTDPNPELDAKWAERTRAMREG